MRYDQTCTACGKQQVQARGLCRVCYHAQYNAAYAEGGGAVEAWKSYKKLNKFDGLCACGGPHYSKGFCRKCYYKQPELADRRRDRGRAWRAANQQRNRDTIRRWHAQNKGSALHHAALRRQTLRHRGLTLEEYNEMMALQCGRCAICRRTPAEASTTRRKSKYLSVDHDHDTGTVRGLLCHQCNSGIGLLGDDVSLLWTAIHYLSLHLAGVAV